jgi:hypothetical protein
MRDERQRDLLEIVVVVVEVESERSAANLSRGIFHIRVLSSSSRLATRDESRALLPTTTYVVGCPRLKKVGEHVVVQVGVAEIKRPRFSGSAQLAAHKAKASYARITWPKQALLRITKSQHSA